MNLCFCFVYIFGLFFFSQSHIPFLLYSLSFSFSLEGSLDCSAGTINSLSSGKTIRNEVTLLKVSTTCSYFILYILLCLKLFYAKNLSLLLRKRFNYLFMFLFFLSSENCHFPDAQLTLSLHHLLSCFSRHRHSCTHLHREPLLKLRHPV